MNGIGKGAITEVYMGNEDVSQMANGIKCCCCSHRDGIAVGGGC